MDAETARMLADLPDDLRDQGWVFDRLESGEGARTLARVRKHRAIYWRPYDRGIDPVRLSGATIKNGHIRVSTQAFSSPNWEDAFRDAVEMMRSVDAKRQVAE